MMAKTVRRMRHLKQKGMTLIELVMVIGLGALIIVGGVLLYQVAFSGTKTNDVTRQLLGMSAGIRNLYANQAGYSGLDMATLYRNNSLPADMRVDGEAGVTSVPQYGRHALGGWVHTTAYSAGSRFLIRFSDVPSESCVKLATMATGGQGSGGVDGLFIQAASTAGQSSDSLSPTAQPGGTNIMGGGNGGRVDVAAAQAACFPASGETRVHMTWQQY